MFNALIGAQMYSARTLTQNAADMRAALKAVSEIGYNSVQLSAHGADIDYMEIADMLAENSLVCPSTHISFKEMEEDLPGVIKRHKAWNCAYPGVGGMPFEMGASAEGFREFARRANAVAAKLHDAGMQFIYHNHAFEFQNFGGVTGMDILLEELREAQFEIDVYWAQSGGVNPVDMIKKVAGRMDVVHYKDMTGRLPNAENRSMTDMAPIGEGNLNWTAIMTACEEIGVKYAFVEQDNAVLTDPIACLRTSYDNLVKLGGRF